MIWKPVPVYVASIFFASTTSAFSDDFTDVHRVLKHFDITVIKTAKDLAAGAETELNSSRLPRQVVLHSSPDSCLRITSAKISSSQRPLNGPQENSLRRFANRDLVCSAEFQWGPDEVTDRDVKAPVKYLMLMIDDEHQICDKTGSGTGGIIVLSKGFPSWSAISARIQYPAKFTSGYLVWVVIGADSEDAPWRLLAYHRMSVSR